MGEAEAATQVVCDAGPLIHLDELGQLDLLRDFSGVLVPDSVWQEVKRHRPAVLWRRSLKLRRVLDLPEAAAELAELAQAFSLDNGELAALRLMQVHPDAILLTDDAAARLVGQRLGFEIHGTIGIVVRALRRRQRTKRQVLNTLRAIPRRSSLFIERDLLRSVIEQIANG